MKNKIIDLFAGAGGLSEGFRRNGFDIVAHVEMDKDASYTLKTREAYYYCKKKNMLNLYTDYLQEKISREELYKNIPKSVINKVINEEISDNTLSLIFNKIDNVLKNEKVLGIIGGPPCQAYSVAGRSRMKEKIKNDPRNYLYLYYLEFIKKYNPSFFVFENVQGILSAKKGTIFQDIKDRMKKLGYTIDYKLLDSNDFGVVQHRKRIIIIGYKRELNIDYPKFDKINFKYSIKDLFQDLPKIKDGEINNNYSSYSNDCLENLKIRNKSWNVLTYNQSRKLNDND